MTALLPEPAHAFFFAGEPFRIGVMAFQILKLSHNLKSILNHPCCPYLCTRLKLSHLSPQMNGPEISSEKKANIFFKHCDPSSFFHDLSMVGRVTLCAGSHSSEENWDQSTILHLNNTMWYNRCFLLAHGLPLRYSKGPPRKKKKYGKPCFEYISPSLFITVMCCRKFKSSKSFL